MSSHGGKSPVKTVGGFFNWFGNYGIEPVYVLVPVGLILMVSAILITDVPTHRWVGLLFSTSPIWLPMILFPLFFESWMGYVQFAYNISQGRTTLEIQFPQEVFKSPLAMELVLIQMYQIASPDNHVETYWVGKHPPTYGLEIVSDGGRIHFYINTPTKKFKNIIESQLYAQYPGIIVTELPVDYTAEVPWDPAKFLLFSFHLRLKQPDPYPIKTYIDYGLDKDPKEEFKIDPLATVLELMGSIQSKEKIWIQILISAHRKVDFKTGSLKAHADWKDDVSALIDKIAQRDSKKKGTLEFDSAPKVTAGERDLIEALERSRGKYAFNTRIRTMYIGEPGPGGFNPGERIGAILTVWRSFDDLNRNQFGMSWRTDFDWNWWQDPSGKKRAKMKEEELHHYKTREIHPMNGIDKSFILTTEELATLFHPAGAVLATPALERVPSARSEPPPNLPRGTGV